MKLDDGHGDGGDQKRWSSAPTWKRRKRKTKTKCWSRQMYQIGFYFSDQDTIESVIMFRINSRTIKRGNLCLSGYQVPLGDMILAYTLGT